MRADRLQDLLRRLTPALRRLVPLSIVLLVFSTIAAEARGGVIPVPDEYAPGSTRPESPAPQAPESSPDRQGTTPVDAVPPPAAVLCGHDRCRHIVVWHVTNRSDKSCLDVSTADLGADGDIVQLKSLLPAATFTISQGKCAR